MPLQVVGSGKTYMTKHETEHAGEALADYIENLPDSEMENLAKVMKAVYGDRFDVDPESVEG